jgi:hypothetical protein
MGAQMAVSIFIALMITSCWPALTADPGLTWTSITVPAGRECRGIGCELKHSRRAAGRVLVHAQLKIN